MLRPLLVLLALALAVGGAQQPALVPHALSYAPGKQITLNLPQGFDINVAASGMRRLRFLAQSPDGRIFATDMFDLSDNTRGSILILGGWDAQSHRFTRVTPYLAHLRNPNNVAFWTDPASGQSWIYVPLTGRLERFPYKAGDMHPSGPGQTLMRFPDYGISYKYGGWHLTRTVAVATLHGRTRVFVAAGSSCDYCREHEVVRASLVAMDPDGSHQQVVAHGLRNAVDLRFLPDLDGGSLFATNMGDDHLGNREPEDTFFELDANNRPGPIASVQPHQLSVINYGWPTCFFAHGKPTLDTTPLPEMAASTDVHIAERPAEAADSSYGAQPGMHTQGTLLAAAGNSAAPDPNADLGSVPAPLTRCDDVPAAYNTFAAHSSPLGLAWFGSESHALQNSFLVVLHGASTVRIGTGYRVIRFTPGSRTPQPFLTGFLTQSGSARPVIHGRPCGLLRLGPDTFLLTDDRLGVVYFIHPHS